MLPEEKSATWLSSSVLDDSSRKSILEMQEKDPTTFIDSFYRNLEFGTGGLRGLMGIGSNRMNIYTVGMATQGLANYLKIAFPNSSVRVALAHDSRNNSRLFAETAAEVFSANDIDVYLFESLRPTPELSFAIRELKCQSGVVVTASHNPKEYNGYKAYWNDGAQLVPPHDKNVISQVEKIASLDDVKWKGKKEKIHHLGSEMDEMYLSMIQKLCLSPSSIKKQSNLGIVYSSIHGTGITLVPEILKRIGFTNVQVVEEQAVPDGNFPTVIYPNPEEAEALNLALEKAKKVGAELVMATDPDSDRVGIAVRNAQNEFILLNGNQTGSLLIYYLLERWKESNKLTGKEYIVKTIVTTEQIKAIAKSYNVPCYETLTGFKYIAEVIRTLEGKETFIGGGEESYGYLIGDKVRDKDAIASCAILAEMTAWSKDKGLTLYQLLQKIAVDFGLYQEGLVSITKKGKEGSEQITKMMADFRENPPSYLAGIPIHYLIDYKLKTKTDLLAKTTSPLEFPVSDVLQFVTTDGSVISVRPSGTEPKIKFYFSVSGSISSVSEYEGGIQLLKQKIDLMSKEMQS